MEIQDYLQKQFEIDANTSATIIITITIFFLGIIASELIKFLARLRTRRNIRYAFIVSINNLELQIKKQAEAYLKTSSQFQFKEDKSFSFRRGTINFHNSTEIGYKASFDAFFSGIENISFKRKLKIKAFNKIWETIRSIEFWHDKSFSDIDFFIEKYNQHNERRNDVLVESAVLPLNGVKVPTEVHNYISAIDQIFINWQEKNDKSRPDVVHKNLVVPLRQINKKNPSITLARLSTDLLLLASHEFGNMSNLLSTYQKQYEDYSRLFRFYYRLMHKCLKIVK